MHTIRPDKMLIRGRENRVESVAQLAECLSNIQEALGWVPCPE